MRFLLDQNLSPLLVELLAHLGHDAVHVRQLGMSRASDAEIMATARDDNRVVVSGDTDFGELLARTNAASPSLVLFRRQGQRRAAEFTFCAPAVFWAQLLVKRSSNVSKLWAGSDEVRC